MNFNIRIIIAAKNDHFHSKLQDAVKSTILLLLSLIHNISYQITLKFRNISSTICHTGNKSVNKQYSISTFHPHMVTNSASPSGSYPNVSYYNESRTKTVLSVRYRMFPRVRAIVIFRSTNRPFVILKHNSNFIKVE